MKISHSRPLLAVSGLALTLLLAFGYGAYRYARLASDRAETAATLESVTSEKLSLENKLAELQGDLTRANDENQKLSDELARQTEINEGFAAKIKGISYTVGNLDKLSKTDPELLQKYSKVYFLNEHYTPSALTDIEPEYLYNEDRPMQIHAKVWPELQDLMDHAEEDGVTLKVISAYRSFGTQAALKSSYTVTYGAGTANQFSADQGYSEHQLGTTVDFTTPAVGATFTGFEKSEAYTWLQENAYKHGFVLSYPEDNAYYQFEPWHWRFVGTTLARKLHNDDMSFYDMDQRDIDSYLIDIFE